MVYECAPASARNPKRTPREIAHCRTRVGAGRAGFRSGTLGRVPGRRGAADASLSRRLCRHRAPTKSSRGSLTANIRLSFCSRRRHSRDHAAVLLDADHLPKVGGRRLE